MPADVIFKKATFGGFDKEDVMSYIEKMKSREAELRKLLTEFEEKNNALEKQLGDMTSQCKSLENARSAMQSEYEAKIAQLTEENNPDMSAIEKIYEEERSMYAAEIENLKNEAQKEQSALIAQLTEAKNECENLRNSHNHQIESIKSQYEEKIRNMKHQEATDRATEERVGTVMLDVRRYADLLIREICEKFDNVSGDVDNTVAQTLSKILSISTDIQMFSDKMSRVLTGLILESDKISKELTEYKDAVKVPYDETAAKMHKELFGD